MAEDCTDADYLGAYSRFFAEFMAKVNPYDQLPVSVSSYNVTDAEIVGEIINVTLQYLNQTQCPPSLQAHLVHQVIQEIKSMCKKQPEDCGFKYQEKIYTSLKLMQAITGKVNEICTRYLDNSRLALLPPPPSTPLPQVIAGGYKNCNRRMEDRYAILHDLQATFGFSDDTVANYYAVFDGHAGQDAATYCATHLHQYLAESIYYPTDPERALRDAFITTDAQFIEKSKTQRLGGGTTAVCTLLLNKKLYCSWVGDSQAILIKRDSIVQLVNPHQLNREDEVQRIRKMGGVVMRSMGMMRVNGALSVSRAIGDVRYKPFVTSDPESKVYTLDGTEDFLVLATDGLTDFMKPAEILTILYHEIHRNPNGLKRAHQILLQWAKHAGSKDNITLVVVLLTPVSEIAARPANAHPHYSSQVDDILEKMNSKEKPLFLDIDDAHNAINSNILKQAIISQETRDQDDDGILAASNGKHENGDTDYDYSDLGPETDVDAIDDVATMPVKNLSYEFYKDDESSQDGDHADRDSNILDNANQVIKVKQPDAENNLCEDEDEDEDEDDEVDEVDEAREVVQVPQHTFEALCDDIREKIEEAVNDEVGVKDGDRVDNARDVIEDAGPMEYDSPPSPQANKPLQHALIPEADNVADSEDSEDEWNYYRVDPNKEKDSATPVKELQEDKNERQVDSPELPVEDIESKIQSEDIEEEEEEEAEEEEEKEIKCKSPKEELSELIDTEISAKDRAVEPQQEKLTAEEQEESKDMSFQLNPDAAEFIPVSPQFTGNRMNLIEDYPISGSPLKQVPEMDDIQVPSQSEFEEEVCRRPREVEPDDKEYTNGERSERNDQTDFMAERQKSIISFQGNLDDSEISSTKAEFGDESTASFLTASEFHRTGMSNVDESFSSSEREYDIAKDPMAMSFTPSDFEAAFDKGVDLNAVHNLSSIDLDVKNGSIEEEEGPVAESPEPRQELNELETDQSPRTPTPLGEPAEPAEPAELVNLSSQQEDSEATFIEHADEPKAVVDFLTVQTESSQLEQQETTRSDHSPLSENYSAECESEKEAMSVDNEQPLSPSSVDIDETKPLDEASEDAVLPGSDLQKEASVKEVDTPSSLSPVPDAMENDAMENDAMENDAMENDAMKNDAMENDAVAPAEDAEASAPAQFALHADVPEFKAEHFGSPSFFMGGGDVSQSYLMDTVIDKLSLKEPAVDVCTSSLVESVDEVCQFTRAEPADDVCQFSPKKTTDEIFTSSVTEPRDICLSPTIGAGDACQEPTFQADDVCQSPVMKAEDVCQSPVMKAEDVCQLNTVETSDTQEPLEQNLIDTQIVEEKIDEPKIDEPKIAQPAQSGLLDFAEEEEVCMRSHFAADPTPPPTPQKFDVAESIDDLVCPMKPSVEEKTEEIVDLMEALMKPEVLETKAQKVEESVKETTLKLSDSMQEFTGLESQLQPTLEKTPEEAPMVCSFVPQFQQEIPKQEELIKEATEPEKLAEPVIEECKLEGEKKIEDISTAVIEEVPIVVEAAPSVMDAAPSEEKAPSVVESVPPVVESVPPAVEAVALPTTEEVPPKAEEEVSSQVKEPEVAPPAKTSELKLAAEVAVAAAAMTAVGAAATTAHKLKSKPAGKPTKTTPSKTAQKSLPTSPSKTVTSTTKASATGAKKPATSLAARPKDLDAPKKTALSSQTSNKAPLAKPAPKATTTASSTTAKSTTRTNVSSTAKPKPAPTAPKAAASDRKPTTNGEVKPSSKPAAAKPPASKVSSTTKTSLVKTSTSTARTSTGAATTAKPRPTSAATASKPSTAAKPSAATTATAAARPKTAPLVGNAAKPRPPMSAKSPIIDKQVKETANKQISMGRTSSTTKTSRVSATGTTTTTVKRVSSVTKTATTASPTKKTAVTSKVASKTSTGGKTTASEKAKVVQNGVSEKINAIVDDMPKKDLSPVVTPNDNQLIMSSD